MGGVGEGGASVNLSVRVAQHSGSVSEDLEGYYSAFSVHRFHDDDGALFWAQIHCTTLQTDAAQYCAMHTVRQIRHPNRQHHVVQGND